MLLYLLFPAFILGVVGLPADNATDGLREEIIQLDGTLGLLGNQTFNISLKDESHQRLSSNKDQLSELEEKLGPPTNQTLNITTEGPIKSINETSSFYKDQLIEPEEKLVLPANQTLNITVEDKGAIKSSHDPSTITNIYKDQLTELEEKLGLPTNQTMNITTEDDERFQDQEEYHRPGPTHCNDTLLAEYSHMVCGDPFHLSMMSVSKQHWCDLNHFILDYNDMTTCMELLSNMLGCYYPNPSVQDFFLYIHSQYFYDCSEDLLLHDAPHGVVVVLTLLPVSLIPILVFLVVWKSKVCVSEEGCGQFRNLHTSGIIDGESKLIETTDFLFLES